METNNKVKASETSLNQIFDKVVENGEPLVIDAENQSFVILTEEDWRGLQETLYLCSQPGFLDRFKKAIESPEVYDASDLGLF